MSECDKVFKARVVANSTLHFFPNKSVVQYIRNGFAGLKWFRGENEQGDTIEQLLASSDFVKIAVAKEKKMEGIKTLWVVEIAAEDSTDIVAVTSTRQEARDEKREWNDGVTDKSEKARIVRYERREVIR